MSTESTEGMAGLWWVPCSYFRRWGSGHVSEFLRRLRKTKITNLYDFPGSFAFQGPVWGVFGWQAAFGAFSGSRVCGHVIRPFNHIERLPKIVRSKENRTTTLRPMARIPILQTGVRNNNAVGLKSRARPDHRLRILYPAMSPHVIHPARPLHPMGPRIDKRSIRQLDTNATAAVTYSYRMSSLESLSIYISTSFSVPSLRPPD